MSVDQSKWAGSEEANVPATHVESIHLGTFMPTMLASPAMAISLSDARERLRAE